MQTSKVFSELLDAYMDPAVRIIRLKGGTRSGKTWSTLQLLDFIGRRSKVPRLISCVSETMPHLKKGAIRDFKNMLEAENAFNPQMWHDTDKLYTYGKGKLEFFSADTPGKVHGPARQVLYINEAINISHEVYRQLAIRTTEKIIIDDNPMFQYWADTKLATRADYVCLNSTYLDNDMLSAAQIAEIESNREEDPEWWTVYGEGKTGSSEGLVIKPSMWDQVNNSSVPPRSEWKKAFIGVDFGWSAPTAIEAVILGPGNEVWIDEIAYQRNMDNPDIARAILESPYAHLEAVCDKAEPKSIKELRTAGVRAVACENKDIKLGIRVMNRYKKHYTKRSVGSIAENRLYRRPKNPTTGEYEELPLVKDNHAKDAERYVFLNRLDNSKSGYSVTASS